MLVVIMYCFTVFLSSYDWSCVYNQSSADCAVSQLNSVVTEALKLAIYSRKSKFPCWFSSSLKYYSYKKNYHLCHYNKIKSAICYSFFAYFCKLVKLAIKLDWQQWLISVDDSLKTHPQHFWKYVSDFKRKDNFYSA
jgi:hypothetical protein